MITKYCIFTLDGDLFPVAYSLIQEGKDVLVCQIDNPNLLGTDTWLSQKEDPEVRRRRLSLYDGMLEKLSLPKMYSKMIGIKDKDNCFVIFGHNSLYKISDRVRKMGFNTGLFPNEDDYIREQERQKSKDFVKKYYPGLKVAETKEFSNVDEVIKFVEESDKFWVVKSDGNHGETIVPDRDDLELAKQQIKSELTNSKNAYNQGKLILEQKIMNAIEFAPQMIWYNGKPVCSEVEIETRMFGSGDIGDQTGGNENVVIPTMVDDKINEIAFPQIMHDIAKKHVGMFIADAGILSDGKDLYFTEFAGSRWGWGGIFSELSAAGSCDDYFQAIVEGEDPYRFDFGVGLAVYSIRSDSKFPMLNQEGLSIFIKDESRSNFFIMQCKMKKDQLVNVGYREFDSEPLGYVVGRGDTLQEAVKEIYDTLQGISMKGIFYRPYEDFLSEAYTSSVVNRIKFLEKENLI